MLQAMLAQLSSLPADSIDATEAVNGQLQVHRPSVMSWMMKAQKHFLQISVSALALLQLILPSGQLVALRNYTGSLSCLAAILQQNKVRRLTLCLI